MTESNDNMTEITTTPDEGTTEPAAEAVTCDDCGKVRTTEPDYNPFALLVRGEVGWYSGNDGELCPPCIAGMIAGANR
jgi:hypothetical protein